MRAFKAELEHGRAVSDPLHHAAMSNDYDRVHMILSHTDAKEMTKRSTSWRWTSWT